MATTARATRANARNDERTALTAALTAAGLPFVSFIGNVPSLIHEHGTATAALAALQEGEKAKAEAAAREAAREAAEATRRDTLAVMSEAEYAALVAEAEAAVSAAVNDMIASLATGRLRLQAVGVALNVLAHTKGFGVATLEPWFEMGARRLPSELRAHYDRLAEAYKAEGYNGEFSARWQNIRIAARAHAGEQRWWGLAPVVVNPDPNIGEGEGEGEGGEDKGKGKGKAKTPAQKAVAALRAIAKVIKDAEGDDFATLNKMTPSLTEAARILGHDFATLA
jgi:hypothetical protein